MPTQVTLVSLYGRKEKDFEAAILRWQQLVKNALGFAFTPYDVRQVHGTIVGLERHRPPACNANFAKYRGQDVAMDLAGMLAHLRASHHMPLKIQVGGFAEHDRPFASRDATPYERSFSIQGDKVVVVGWPVSGAANGAPAYPLTLDVLRREFQKFGILYNYHRTPADVDNDLFFRIGLIDPDATTPDAAKTLQRDARNLLASQPPLVLDIDLDRIYVTAYEDDRLSLSSTRTWSLADPKVNGQLVAGLYGGPSNPPAENVTDHPSQ